MGKGMVIIVEDEDDISELVSYNLKREGYDVLCLASGEDCVAAAKRARADLILLDIMLPGIDGFEVCRMLKSDTATENIPVIILTAKGDESDIVVGLELGADDYITKPFSPKVLIARVRTALRRKREPAAAKKTCLSLHGVSIDTLRHEVLVDGAPLTLTSTEFRLLHLMMRSAGRVFTRDQIVDAVHGEDYPVTARSIDVQIVNLRRKLSERGELIETVRGVGYRFKEV